MKNNLSLIFFVSIAITVFVGISLFISNILNYSEENMDFPSNQIVILSSEHDREILSDFFKRKNRFLPIEEDFYKIRWISADSIDAYKNFPVLLMVKNKDRKDSLSHKAFDHIFKNKNENSKVNIIKDTYSNNQTILGIEVLDSLDLINTLNEYSESINKIDLQIEDLILRKYKRIPENEEIVRYIKNKYNADIFVDHEYTIIKNQKDILWVGRGNLGLSDPYRWIIIREIGKHSSLEERIDFIQSTFNQIMSESNSIKISYSNNSKTYEYMYNNNYIIGGIYTLSEIVKNSSNKGAIPTAGGPYISYILNRKEKNDLLLIGLVNSPDQDKMIYLKQLEAVFKNVK